MSERDSTDQPYQNYSPELRRLFLKLEHEGIGQVRVCPFRNNDVPEFLERLDRFEEASRKTIIQNIHGYSEAA